MSVGNLMKWIIALAMCYFSFVVLQQHYTEEKTWGASIKEASKHVGIGFSIVVASPAGMIILAIAAIFLVLTIGDAL